MHNKTFTSILFIFYNFLLQIFTICYLLPIFIVHIFIITMSWVVCEWIDLLLLRILIFVKLNVELL